MEKARIALDLPEPPLYLPMRNGRYDVAPGLTRLNAADFGNGARDGFLFQFDRHITRYLANKRTVHAEAQPHRHSGRSDYGIEVAAAVVHLIVARLTAEYPDVFTSETNADGGVSLHSYLTGETLRFAENGVLVRQAGNEGYPDALGALCGQFAEDIVVIRRGLDGRDLIAALEVAAPSSWAPEDKIGRSFDTTHVPVPGMERSRAAASGLVNAMIHRPPTVRFTWGIEFTDELNLHPSEVAHSRSFPSGFDSANAPLFLRVERQTTWGLPEVDAALFAIRVYIYDLRQLLKAQPEIRSALVRALESMSAESRIYKSLPPPVFGRVVDWLNRRNTPGNIEATT